MSNVNPYDPNPPAFAPEPPPLPVSGAVPAELPPYSFSEAWERGWRVFKANYAVLLAAGVVVVGASVFDSLVQAGLRQIHELVSLVWSIAFGFCISIPLSAGVALVGARAARGGAATVNDLFLGFRRMGWLILWAIAAGCACMAAVVPGAIVAVIAFAAGGETVGLLVTLPIAVVYLAIFICLSMRFVFVPTMLADPELPRLDPVECVKASWKLTAECWGSLIGLYIVVGFLAFASLFLLCVGIIFVGYPMMIAITGSAYALVVMPLVRQRAGAIG